MCIRDSSGTGEYVRKATRFRFFPRTEVRVMLGEPLDLSPWAGREGDRAAEREVTDELMRRIQALTGQEYVHDIYGADMKKRYQAVRESGHNLLDQPVDGQR